MLPHNQSALMSRLSNIFAATITLVFASSVVSFVLGGADQSEQSHGELYNLAMNQDNHTQPLAAIIDDFEFYRRTKPIFDSVDQGLEAFCAGSDGNSLEQPLALLSEKDRISEWLEQNGVNYTVGYREPSALSRALGFIQVSTENDIQVTFPALHRPFFNGSETEVTLYIDENGRCRGRSSRIPIDPSWRSGE
jgi:hypothetical protein